MTVLTSTAPELQRDRYGRPLVIPPGGGKPVPYTRATTYIDCLEDKFNLQKWMQRMVASGLVQRPDLMLAASTQLNDKKALDRTCDAAREAAAAGAKATIGTALHALTEVIDRGEELPVIPPNAKASLDAYVTGTSDLTATHIEQFTVFDKLQIGGTPDRIVRYGDDTFIADVKTGSIEWGALKIAMQLAIYARAQTYDIATGERGPHGADMTRAVIIHLPTVDDPADATCSLHWVDIEAGWYAVQVAAQVREKRKLKFSDLTEPFGPFTRVQPGTVPGNTGMKRERTARERAAADQPPSLAEQIASCTSYDAISALWSANESSWSDDLTAAAKARIAELPAAS